MEYLFKKINLEKNDAIIQFGNSFEVDRFLEFDLFKGQTTDRLELERQLLNDPNLEIEKTSTVLIHLFEMHEYLAISNKHEAPKIKKGGKLRKEYIRPTAHYYWSNNFKLAMTKALRNLTRSSTSKVKEIDLIGDYYANYSLEKSLLSTDKDYAFLDALGDVSNDIRINLIDFVFDISNQDYITHINSERRKRNPIIIFNLTKDKKEQQEREAYESYKEAADD